MTWALPSTRRHRWPGVIAAILAYVAAMYFSYVDTFVYFLNSPFRPNGPYGTIPSDQFGTGVSAHTCLSPHLVFGQICRDWSQQATTTWSRVGFGAVFLIGFLLLALLARRVVWIFLVVPLATIPYAHTERKVWAVSALVAFLSTGALVALRFLGRGSRVSRVRWLPLGVLIAGTACAVVLSVITGAAVPPLHSIPGLTTWRSTQVNGIACPSATSCVAVGEYDAPNASIAIALSLHGDAWSRPTRLGRAYGLSGIYGLSKISCADVEDCVGVESLTWLLLSDYRGRWSRDDAPEFTQANFPLVAPTTSCSPGGMCWVAYENFVATSATSSYRASWVVGERDGRWVPPRRIGPQLSHYAKTHHGGVVVNGVSCWSPSSCTVVGSVYSGSQSAPREGLRGFVQTETNGVWGPPRVMPTWLAGSPKGSFVSIPLWSPMVCTGRGTCLLGGAEVRGNTSIGAATEQEVSDRWLPPVIGDGVATGAEGSYANAIACHETTLCVASEVEATPRRSWISFRAEARGRWQPALQVPIAPGGIFDATDAICPSESSCDVVGRVLTTKQESLGFVARFEHGRWLLWTYGFGLGAYATTLNGVACEQPTSCWAVGAAFWSDSQREVGFAFPLSDV